MSENQNNTLPPFPKNLRVLFYAINGLGLGHLTRLVAICQALKRILPSIEPLFVTTSDGDNILSKYNIPYVHLPSKTVAAQTETLTTRRLARLYNAILNPLYDSFQPHLLVVDTMTTGALHDLLNILRFGNCCKVFIHRAKKAEVYEQADIQAQRFYDLVIAPHYFNTELIPMPIGFEIPLFWSGTIMLTDVQNNPPLERSLVRKRFNVQDNEVFVLLSLGGGGDNSNPETIKKIMDTLKQFPQIKILFAQGLLYKGEDFSDKVLTTSEYPMTHIFSGIDFAISGAGYNTFHELLHFGIPTIFVPKMRGLDDQHTRVQKAYEKESCLFCIEDELFMENLNKNITILLQENYKKIISNHAKSYVPQNHAEEAAKAILNILEQKFYMAETKI
jgi:predicted glycosyltransferase